MWESNVRRKHPWLQGPAPKSLGALPCFDGGGAEGAEKEEARPHPAPLGLPGSSSGLTRLWQPQSLFSGERGGPATHSLSLVSALFGLGLHASLRPRGHFTPQKIPLCSEPLLQGWRWGSSQRGGAGQRCPWGSKQPCPPPPSGSPGQSGDWVAQQVLTKGLRVKAGWKKRGRGRLSLSLFSY